MGCCCSRKKPVVLQGDLALGPAPARPVYDSEGYCIDPSPTSGAPRRRPRTESADLALVAMDGGRGQ